MSQNKIITFFHNNLIATIIAALLIGGGFSALAFSAYNSGAKSVQSNSTSSSSMISSSSPIKASSVSSLVLSSSIISSSSVEEVKKEVVKEPFKEVVKEAVKETPKSVEVEKPKVVNVEKLLYTNQFYPGLQINYDSSWKLEKENTESNYKGLLNGTLKFTKANQEFKVLLTPYMRGSCYPMYGHQFGGEHKFTTKEKTIVNQQFYRGIFDYYEEDPEMTPQNAFQYLPIGGEEYSCFSGIVKTNITTKEILDLNKDNENIQNEFNQIYKKGLIEYRIDLSYKGDKSTFEEADQIIKNSIFPF
jgi:hypothetical protein